MTHMDRLLAQEAGGELTGLYQVIASLATVGEPSITTEQAIGIMRCVNYVLSHGDDHDVQIGVGSVYMRDLEVLVERSGRAWLDYQTRHNIGGQRSEEV